MIVRDSIVSIPDYDPLRFMHFQSEEHPNTTLYIGKQGDIDNINPNTRNIFVDFEQPNMWFNYEMYNNCLLNEKRYDYIFTECPYVYEWRNNILNTKKYILISHFINKKYIYTNDKKYDIIYAGHVKPYHQWILDGLKPFNSVIISGRGLSYEGKMEQISQSKITLIHNILYLSRENRDFIVNIPRYEENKAWTEIDTPLRLCPQLKTRAFEAAASKSLILCRRDSWNMIEKFFEPDEFVYFDESTLQDTIRTILDNYDFYKPIIDKAYNKFINNYTTDQITRYIP